MALVFTFQFFLVGEEESIIPSSTALGNFVHDNKAFWRVRREREGKAIVRLRWTGYRALFAKGKAARNTLWLLEKIRILEIKFREDEIESKEK